MNRTTWIDRDVNIYFYKELVDPVYKMKCCVIFLYWGDAKNFVIVRDAFQNITINKSSST